MVDFALEAAPLLGGVDKTMGSVRIRERDDLALVSIAIPIGGEKDVQSALNAGWKIDMPTSTVSTNAGDLRAIRIAPDQLMLAFPHTTLDAEQVVNTKLDGAGYTTDQTDVWVSLEISGEDGLTALERLCPLDLNIDAFPVESAARTVMEHMSAMIVRMDQDRFLLLSASSSAASFLDAVETSAENIQP